MSPSTVCGTLTLLGEGGVLISYVLMEIGYNPNIISIHISYQSYSIIYNKRNDRVSKPYGAVGIINFFLFKIMIAPY